MAQRKTGARGKAARKTESDPRTVATVRRKRTSEGSLEFPIAGIGASAGGLEAFKQMLEAVPANTGMAFIFIQHLSPNHPSSLAAILGRTTPMLVTEVKDENPVLPNRVYVIPPGQDMTISSGRLRLSPREIHGQHRPIDLFLHSLAEDRKHLAIAVVLSGTGNDGTIGLQAIKAEGGITFAQDASAQHDSMPRSAIVSGCVDFVLSPAEIGREITRIARSSLVASSRGPEEAKSEPNRAGIVKILHQATGVDFSSYKGTTLHRRIARRMVLHSIESFADYATHLHQNPGEVEALYRDILIHVTRFFRDADSYEALKTEVFPELIKNRTPDSAVRIWSLGCSTGEEAYSLAISFAEFVESTGVRMPAQIFATDLNEVSIQKARVGAYPKYIAQDISAERLRRFFYEADGNYRISKSIREMCVFSRHNVLADPPFARMDLVSCRNLLIYLQPELQQYLMAILHYALNPAGFLWVGASETIGSYRDWFETKDSKHKIYMKRAGSRPAEVRLRLQRKSAMQADFEPSELRPREFERTQLYREGDRILLARYAPPSVLVSSELEVLQFRGDTSPYLAAAPGKATLNLLRMLREGLLPGLHAAIARAGTERAPVRQENLQVKTSGGFRQVTVEVIPINTIRPNETGFLILFAEPVVNLSTPLPEDQLSSRPVETGAGKKELARSVTAEERISQLSQELAETRAYLQSVIEQQEAANEDLQSANEEVQSANEELQSVNEELETSKEEIESSNEELATVNDELNNRNLELSLLNNDLNNIFDNVEMPVILVGRDLRIRRFTKYAEQTLNLNAADLGRPIGQIQLSVAVPEMPSLLMETIDQVAAREREFQDRSGRWFSLRIRPYKTLENKIDGAILALIDIDTIKRTQRLAENIVATVREPLLVLDANLRVQAASRSFHQLFQLTPEATEGQFFYELGEGQWNDPDLRRRLEQVWEKDESFSDFSITRDFAGLGRRIMVLNARPLLQDNQQKPLILLAIEDVTSREELQIARLTEAERTGRAEELVRANRNKDAFLAMLAHELRNPLAPLSNAAEILATPDIDATSIENARKVVQRQLRHLTRMIDDLLDISRITQDKIELQRSRIDLISTLKGAAQLSRRHLEDRGQTLDFPIPEEPIYLEGDETRLEQVFGNLLNNASKFSDPGAVISLQVEPPATEDQARSVIVRVRDTGVGIDPEVLPHVFDLFIQGNRALDRSHGGLGVGLTLVKRLVELHGGTVEAHSEGTGRGSEVIVRLPVLLNPAGEAPSSLKSASPKSDRLSPRRRLLVVDDHEDSVTMMAAVLRAKGYDVATARNGTAALEIATSFSPDLVILDIGLPEIDGYEVARRLRKIPAMADTFIVALSGYGTEQDQGQAYEAGFNYHLTKPVPPATLLEFLSRTLEPRS
jgi:two-component system, chemotaxis family, CheB/CheR fusion protein